VRLIWAQCVVRYSGRGDTRLDSYDRLIIIKDDGSVSVHSNSGVKPLNYMGAKSVLTVETDDNGCNVLHFDSSKESLAITLERVYSDQTMGVPHSEPGLVRDGTEDHLQEWLSNNIHQVSPGLRFVQREFETGSGKVDLLAYDEVHDEHVLIEVKRVASSSAVYQVKRYLDAYHEERKRGVLIALDVRPKTRELADKRGITWVELEPSEIHGWKTQINGESLVAESVPTGEAITLDLFAVADTMDSAVAPTNTMTVPAPDAPGTYPSVGDTVVSKDEPLPVVEEVASVPDEH
jgi:RecB family endonuclease NucS